jgi:uncharacterized membrane protein
MNLAHLHLLLNHFPIIGTVIGLGLFVVSLVGKNDDLKRAGLIVFAFTALLTIPTFFSGVGAQGAIGGSPGVSKALIQEHEASAMLATLFMQITGALALVELWRRHRITTRVRWDWNLVSILLFSILTVGVMTRVGSTGGEIRHPEMWSAAETAAPAGALTRVVRALEPVPDRVTELMTISKWWWAFMMDLHFIGLALLIGTIGLLDLRMLGFAKQLPIGPLHRLVPWAMAGFGINVATGILAFTGMPLYYTYDVAFWLKMLAILLLGLNVAAFYLTNTFEAVVDLGPGDDAPPMAKFIAGSSLFLWFAVIALGRYIQSYTDTIPVH